MTFPELPGRLAQVRETISRHQTLGGWGHPVTIVAVTKSHGPEAVRAALAAGLRIVGENRVQEALAKQDQLSDAPVEWHLIGTLQRNKARHAVGRFALIHSVDRLDLARELDRRVPDGRRQPVLVQVNCSNEPQKGGVEPDALRMLLDGLRDLPRLDVRGLSRRRPATGALDGDVGRLSRRGGGRSHHGPVGNRPFWGAPMTDDAFQLTPQDVRTQDFARVIRGYDRAQVDEFKHRLAAEIDRLTRARVQAEERLKSAQDQLRSHRERERAVHEALIAAQELRSDLRAQAEQEAAVIVREAHVEAAKIVDRAKLDHQLVCERTEDAVRQFNAYVASFRLLLERQLGEVDGLQAAAREGTGAPRPPVMSEVEVGAGDRG